MATYIILNCLFLGICLLLLRITLRRPTRLGLTVAALLLIATALFDSALIAAHIIAYDTTKLLGLYAGRAPIEDYFYTLAAVIIIPSLWKRFNKKAER